MTLKTITKTLRVAGLYFQREKLLGVEPKGKCEVRADPNNEHDTKCIDIFWGNYLLGYIPAKTKEQDAIYDSLQAGRGVKAKIVNCISAVNKEGLRTPEIIDIEVEYQEEMVAQAEGHIVITKESITEPKVVVDFNETLHRYTERSTGNILTGGTTRTKKYKTEFDSKHVTPRCAKSWDVSEATIKEIWDGKNGNSAIFGTAIHNAMEVFIKYRKEGAQMEEKTGTKKGYNHALPTHKVVRDIVINCVDILDPLIKKYKVKEVVTEALITDVETKSCGLADLLFIIDRKKKICRIGDYKTTVDPETESSKHKIKKPFNKLPPNKVSGFILQISDYAAQMEKHGWTVEGGDAFVLAEDGSWKHYPLELVDMTDVFSQAKIID